MKKHVIIIFQKKNKVCKIIDVVELYHPNTFRLALSFLLIVRVPASFNCNMSLQMLYVP